MTPDIEHASPSPNFQRADGQIDYRLRADDGEANCTGQPKVRSKVRFDLYGRFATFLLEGSQSATGPNHDLPGNQPVVAGVTVA